MMGRWTYHHLPMAGPERPQHHQCHILGWNVKLKPHCKKTSDIPGHCHMRNIPFKKMGWGSHLVFKTVSVIKGQETLGRVSRLKDN